MRSIPARAGEPGLATATTRVAGVYPRACGGTPRCRIGSDRKDGLSPRVRGNLDDLLDRRETERSIPARAGEPYTTTGIQRLQVVYSRACGGTGLAAGRPPFPWGLSPRVRGNLGGSQKRVIEQRSIPARAGEP